MKKITTLFLLMVMMFLISACNNNQGTVTFELVGKEGVSYHIGDTYVEEGYIARIGSKSTDEVTVTNNIDPSKAGDYEVTYTLEVEDKQHVLTRNVYYRESVCFVVDDTTTTKCDISYSQYLNTYVKTTIYYEGDTYNGQIESIFEEIESIISDYHKLSNKYDLFDGVVNIKTINDNPSMTHTIDQELFDLIDFTMEHQSEVNNLFNLALGPVLKIWHDYREDCNIISSCQVPPLADLQAADQYTDYNDIVLDEENFTITMKPNMSIDVGGVSKGYISEIVSTYLDSLDLTAYLFNNGQSNISAGGVHPLRDHGKFVLGVADPERSSTFDYPGYITAMLGDGDQLVTSGDNQQFYMVGDDLYHHIINPNTLMPERYSRSVSIIVNGDAGLADLYSTAIFAMTTEDGLAFVNGIDGLEAVWYELDGSILYSTNFEEKFLGTQYKTD